MANTTVYPFGTDGQLPSSIGIINDLDTGGDSNALSAEMGKRLGEMLQGLKDTIYFDSGAKITPVDVTFTNKRYVNRQDGSIESTNKTALSVSEIELNNADYVIFNGVAIGPPATTVSTGYAFGYYVDPSDSTTWKTVATHNWDVQGTEKKVKRYYRRVPENATHLRTTSSCYDVLTTDNFFCSLVFGSPLEHNLWGDGGYCAWENVADITVTEKNVVNKNGELTSNKNYNVWAVDVENEDYIRISRLQTVSNATFGFSFYDSSNSAIMPTLYIGNCVAQRLVDEILKVPEGAKWFKFSVRRSLEAQFYIKIPTAEVTSLNEKINSLQQGIENLGDSSKELEVPLTGLVLSDGKVVTDAIYTPEQFNFGGFKVVLPDDITLTWYRGDDPDNFTSSTSVVVTNGAVVKFPKKYTYFNVFKFQFQSSGTISVDIIKEHIAAGRIKILYTPNDGHMTIMQRQSHCEKYVRALQGRLVKNFSSPEARKRYGTHDLPMFVHCTDIHNDIVRLSSAIEYAKYIQADAMVLTGDYPMRGATNGYGYIKDLDEKWNPATEETTQVLPILVGTGNHDPWHSTLENMRAHLIDPFIERYNYRADADTLIEDVAYYYVDLNVPAPRDGGYVNGSSTYNHTQLVRIIMLDIVDEQAGEISRWGISQAQIEWFIDTLNSTPEGAAILIGLHTAPDSMDAPLARAQKYSQESPLSRELEYATDMFTYKEFLNVSNEDLNGSYDFSGSPIKEIIDAFISRTTASGSYTYKVGGTNYSIPQASVVTKTVNWTADFSNAGGIFVAYLCGHTHIDTAGYIKNAVNTQLCLCETCTVCEYGPWANGRGSSSADCLRGSSGSTQDGFNVYVLDMENKRVGIAKIGSNMTDKLEPRTAAWLSFADTPVNNG